MSSLRPKASSNRVMSAFGDGNYGWFNSDICLLYLNVARICNRNKDYEQAISCFEKAHDHGDCFTEAAKEPIKRPTSAGISNATELPSRFVHINEGTFKQSFFDLKRNILDVVKDSLNSICNIY